MGASSGPGSPGALLLLLMRRRGWSATRLAEIAGGVSPSAVRSYTAGRSTPRPPQALAVAQALGPHDGATLLRAWGYPELAEGLAVETAPPRGGRTIEYPGRPLSREGEDLLQSVASWIKRIEAGPPLS